MELTIKVPDELAAEARARGMTVEAYVQEIVARQTSTPVEQERHASVDAAIGRILELRKGNKPSLRPDSGSRLPYSR